MKSLHELALLEGVESSNRIDGVWSRAITSVDHWHRTSSRPLRGGDQRLSKRAKLRFMKTIEPVEPALVPAAIGNLLGYSALIDHGG
jgi:hypothetical protein